MKVVFADISVASRAPTPGGGQQEVSVSLRVELAPGDDPNVVLPEAIKIAAVNAAISQTGEHANGYASPVENIPPVEAVPARDDAPNVQPLNGVISDNDFHVRVIGIANRLGPDGAVKIRELRAKYKVNRLREIPQELRSRFIQEAEALLNG